MPYEIETKDGIVIRNIPDNIKPDDPSILERVAVARKQRPMQQIEPEGFGNPTAGMSGTEKFMSGLGKSFYDTSRGLGQLTGFVSGDDVKETNRLDKPLMNTGAGFAGNVVGHIGQALAPGSLVKGAGKLASLAPQTARFAPGLQAAGSTILAPRTVGQGLAVGSGLGFIQPAEDWQQRALQTGVGGVLTAAVPAAGVAYRGLKSSVEPFYESGQNQILARALRTAAGGQADDVTRQLTQAAQPFVGPSQPGMSRQIMGEIVPGSVPTAAEASGNAGIAALQRAASAVDPAVTQQYAQRAAAQNAARVSQLDDLAGRSGALDFAIANRGATADELYRQAIEKGIDTSRNAATGAFLSKAQQAGRKGEITKLLQRPAIQQAMREARTLAANEGVNMTSPAGSVKGLDYLKRALDDQIGKAQGNEQRVLVELKNRLLTTIDTLSPEYAAARQTFQQMSRPVNQMQIAETLAQKSINPLTGQMQPQAFARNLTDQTAKTATGFKGATLENVMEPQQLGRLGALRDDLARAVAAQNAGRGAGSDTVQKLAYANMLDQAGIPNVLRNFAPAQIVGNIAGRTADAAYGRANRELSQRLAQVLMSPEETAKILSSVDPQQRQMLLAEILRRSALSGAMATPALINSNQ